MFPISPLRSTRPPLDPGPLPAPLPTVLQQQQQSSHPSGSSGATEGTLLPRPPPALWPSSVAQPLPHSQPQPQPSLPVSLLLDGNHTMQPEGGIPSGPGSSNYRLQPGHGAGMGGSTPPGAGAGLHMGDAGPKALGSHSPSISFGGEETAPPDPAPSTLPSRLQQPRPQPSPAPTTPAYLHAPVPSSPHTPGPASDFAPHPTPPITASQPSPDVPTQAPTTAIQAAAAAAPPPPPSPAPPVALAPPPGLLLVDSLPKAQPVAQAQAHVSGATGGHPQRGGDGAAQPQLAGDGGGGVGEASSSGTPATVMPAPPKPPTAEEVQQAQVCCGGGRGCWPTTCCPRLLLAHGICSRL